MNPLRRLVRGFFVLVPEPWQRRVRSLPIVGALVGRLSHAASPLGVRTWSTVRRGVLAGARVRVDPRFERFVLQGEDEFRHVAPRFAELLRPAMIVYDVGAHSGLYSLIAARGVAPGGRVYAFEPDPENLERLHEHVAVNGASTVAVVPRAVWSSSTTVRFVRDDAHALRDQGYVAGEGEGVGAIAIDDFAAEHEPPDVIKIDVEGGEFAVLVGAAQTLARVRPTILCEVHPAGATAPPAPVEELLEGAGYVLELIRFKPEVVHLIARPR